MIQNAFQTMIIDPNILWSPYSSTINQKFQASYIIVLLDLEPGGLKKQLPGTIFFAAAWRRLVILIFRFEILRHACKSSLLTLFEKDQKASEVAHYCLAHTTIFWGLISKEILCYAVVLLT